MLWVKSFHIIAMVAWFSGIFYLPRLFVYHAMATDTLSIERFKVMERKLYYGIMMPAAILTVALGIWLISYQWKFYLSQGWMHAKLTLVFILLGYHHYLGRLLRQFKQDQHQHSHRYYRVINEIPVLLLAGIVICVIVRPF